MIMQIAMGIFLGVLLLVALAVVIFIVSVMISKGSSIRSMKRYDFEEDKDDEFNWDE